MIIIIIILQILESDFLKTSKPFYRLIETFSKKNLKSTKIHYIYLEFFKLTNTFVK